MNTSNIPQEIVDKANNMIAKGSKMSFDALVAMFTKDAAKTAKKNGSKKESAKWQSRANVANVQTAENASVWLAAKNRENAIKNLPSSLK